MRWISLLTLALVTTSGYAQLSYSFDSNAQGWRRADFNSSTLQLTVLGAATWNSGGYVDADDFSGWAFHLSPELSGGFQNSTSLSFDYSSQFTSGLFPFVIMRAGSQAIYQSVAPTSDGAFHNYSFAMTPGTWRWSDGVTDQLATQTDITNVLTSLNQIGVSADVANGTDYTRLDNIQLVPEPMTLIALGSGLALLARTRRARS